MRDSYSRCECLPCSLSPDLKSNLKLVNQRLATEGVAECKTSFTGILVLEVYRVDVEGSVKRLAVLDPATKQPAHRSIASTIGGSRDYLPQSRAVEVDHQPFARIEGERVGVLHSLHPVAELRANERAAGVGRVDVQPQSVLLACASLYRQEQSVVENTKRGWR